MLKYLKKLAMEIIPSVVATILGAYIVNHYINTKPDSPPSSIAAVASAAYAKLTGGTTSKADAPKVDAASKSDASKSDESDGKGDGRPAETSADVAAPVAPVSPKTKAAKVGSEKPSEAKPTETASLPEGARHSILSRRPAPAETPAAAEEHRDATDLARAAIERLRASEGSKATTDAGRVPADPKIISAAPSVSPVRPLPPPITVATPNGDTTGQALGGQALGNPPYTGSVQASNRPTPPAEIPGPRPLDLRADTETTKERMSNVAEDMLSAAKSMFHSVIPK